VQIISLGDSRKANSSLGPERKTVLNPIDPRAQDSLETQKRIWLKIITVRSVVGALASVVDTASARRDSILSKLVSGL
jgi:hypothetical protein